MCGACIRPSPMEKSVKNRWISHSTLTWSPLFCTSVWNSAFSSHLKLNTLPPLFSQLAEMKRKEKWLPRGPDGAVNHCSLTVLKYSYIESAGKMVPPFNTCTRSFFVLLFFQTFFALTESTPLKNFGLFHCPSTTDLTCSSCWSPVITYSTWRCCSQCALALREV